MFPFFVDWHNFVTFFLKIIFIVTALTFFYGSPDFVDNFHNISLIFVNFRDFCQYIWQLTCFYKDKNILDINRDWEVSEKEKLMFICGAVCNNASLTTKGILGDPTEAALLVSAEKAGLAHDLLAKKYKRVKEVPFDSVRILLVSRYIWSPLFPKFS